MNETILITGASGRVAKATANYLTHEGFDVIGASRSIEEDAGSFTDTVRLDLLKHPDLEKLEKLLAEKEVDAVFHLAWNIPEENFDTHKAWKGNMDMYLNVLEASENADIPIFINGSSIHAGTGDIDAYTVDADFDSTPQPYKDSIDPNSEYDLRKDDPGKLLDPREENPDSPYGWHKVMTERILREQTANGDFEIGASIRIGGVNEQDSLEPGGEPYYSTLHWRHKDLGGTIAHILRSDLSDRSGYYQFYGVSDNKGRIFSIENPFIGDKH